MKGLEMKKRVNPLCKFVIAALFALAVGSIAAPSTVSAQGAIGQVKGDPTGATTGTAADVPVKDAKNPTLAEVMEVVGHNRIAINFVWTLLAGFLVMFMQAGFAMVETGFTRAKNAAHTMSMNFMIYPIGMLGYWICGYALQMGGVGAVSVLGGTPPLNHEFAITLGGHTFGLFGLKGLFLSGDTYDVGVFGLFMSMVVYPLFANWVWGGGWLATMGKEFGLGHGHVDFAGSSVVHLVGGMAALAGAIVIGPRLGKYTKSGESLPIPGHDIPMALAGTFILAFGWFGFNPGSTLAGGDLRIAVVATNTMLAGTGGAVFAMFYVMWRMGKPYPSMLANGLLAGLVAITAPCAFVNSVSAMIIGCVAGFLVVESVLFFDRVAKIDDPVGAISVHGVNGAWGVLSLGLFADGAYGDGWNGVPGTVRGLFYGGGLSQFWAEVVGVITCFVTLAVLSLIVYYAIEKTVGNRVSQEVEIE